MTLTVIKAKQETSIELNKIRVGQFFTGSIGQSKGLFFRSNYGAVLLQDQEFAEVNSDDDTFSDDESGHTFPSGSVKYVVNNYHPYNDVTIEVAD